MAAGNNNNNNNYMNKEYINPYNPYCYPSEYPPQYMWYPSSSFYLPQQQQQVITMRQQYLQQQREEEEERRRARQQQLVLWEQLQQRRRQREKEEDEDEDEDEEDEEEEGEEERLKFRQQTQHQHLPERYRDKEERPYSRFLSFLEHDDSFLTPWHWNPDDNHPPPPPAASTSGLKSYMKIEPGSYFANDHHVSKNHEENKNHSSTGAGQVFDGVSNKNLSKIVAEPVPRELFGQNVSRTDEGRVRDEYVDDDPKPSNINVKQASDDTLDDHSRIDVEEVSRSFFKRLDLINAKQAPDNSLDRKHSSSTIDVEEASHSFLERLDRNNVEPRKLRKHKRDFQGTTSS